VTGGNGKSKGPVRCAIYTRKSTSEGLDSDFNTLDAQREAAEHYVRSQAAEGWVVLPEHYDDGGFTGGNIERPALTRLLDGIERGEVDVVVVYKVDRLSRSLLDFARLMERFDRQQVGFVSITQHFDTSTSMGRLILNVLLSFAQFERELISERTRDKIAAARRRGKWTGGPVVLGYQVSADGRGLEIVPGEAEVVRAAFELYEKTLSIGATAKRLNLRGYCQKKRTRKDGTTKGGRPFDKDVVHRLLRNPIYAGKVRVGEQLFAGEHDAIVPLVQFERLNALLASRSTGRGKRKGRPEYLLTGVLRCLPCDAAMSTSVAAGRGGKRYRYYRCRKELHQGSHCSTGLLVADEIESAVIAQLKELARTGDLKRQVLVELARGEASGDGLRAQRERLQGRVAELNAEAKRLLGAFSETHAGGKLLAQRLGEIESDLAVVQHALGETDRHLRLVADAQHDSQQMVLLLHDFDALWDVLVVEERRELLHALIAEVGVDPQDGVLRIKTRDRGHDLPAAEPPGPDEPFATEIANP
jgi:site-specific DNA recombinase